MKAATITSLVLSGIAAAAPAVTTTKTLQLSRVVVVTLTESLTGAINFAVSDPSIGAHTGCKTAWNQGGPSASEWFTCNDPSFSFNFPSGVPDIEAFEILVEYDGFIGSTYLNSAAGTSVYTCQTPGAIPGSSEECTTGDNTVTVEPIH